MTFLCEGVRFLAGPEPPDADIRTLALWRIQDSDGIVFSGGEVIGRNAMGGTSDAAYDASREAQHAWDVLGVDEFRLLGAKASNVWGDCVYIGPSAGVWTTNFEITDCEFSKTGRQGIAVVAGSDGLVARNRLFEMRRAAFNLEPTLATWGAKRIRYEGNRTGRVRLLWMSSYGRGYNVGDIEVVGNIMEAASGTPVILCGPSDYRPGQGRRGPFKVYDNDFIIGGSPAPGFRFIAVDGLEMSNNRCLFPSSRSMTAVELDDCQGASITNNLFTKASRLISDGGIALGHPASTWTETGNTV
jgi:hypothetical protein